MSYTPQSNGLVENLNNQVRKILREMFLRNKNTTWYDKLEIVAINKNNQRNSSIKKNPFNVWHPGYDVRDNTSELLIKEKAKKRIEKYKATEYKIGDLVRVKVSALFSKVRELIKNSNKKYLTGKYTPEVYRVKSILMPDNEGYENNRYTIETLNGILLQTQLKKNNINAVRKAKRFFGSDFLKVPDNFEKTNLTSRDVLKLSKLDTRIPKQNTQPIVPNIQPIVPNIVQSVPQSIPQPVSQDIIQPVVPNIVQPVVPNIVQRPQRRERINYAELNKTGRIINR